MLLTLFPLFAAVHRCKMSIAVTMFAFLCDVIVNSLLWLLIQQCTLFVLFVVFAQMMTVGSICSGSKITKTLIELLFLLILYVLLHSLMNILVLL